MVLTALSSGQISLTDTAALAAKMSYEEAREYVKDEILRLSSQDNQISAVN
jgi:predicted HTH domain antitoxin